MSNVIEGYFGPTKQQRMRAVAYARDLEKTKALPYEQKFSELFELCESASSLKVDVVIIAYPEVLGDSHEEVMISLSLLANANLLVAVAGQSPAVSIG